MSRPELEASRKRVEESLRRVREALASELGRRPRGRAWVLPLLGVAVGLALAWGIGSAGSRRKRLAGRDRKALSPGPDA